ncbi:MAG: amino acid adenylation domain-containing protein, partial [Oscillospiraceae bacterium]|nr:amino acid adenylation domain-containing protein [Oscillospiraceae bacterium]
CEENSHFEAPRTEREKCLAQAFSKVLGLEQVGLRDSFFELGGHSLRIADLLNEIESLLGLRLSFREVFTHPTVEELAQCIPERALKQRILPGEKLPYYPATPTQKNIYIAQERDPLATGYHIPVAYAVRGSIDLQGLTQALNALLARHEILRTSFRTVEGEICQVPTEELRMQIPLLSLREGQEFSEAFSDFIRPFDLKHGPLLRMTLAKRGEEQQLWIDIHHIIADGASMPILLQELSALYEGKTLSPVTLQYRDFSQWLMKQDLSSTEEQWALRCGAMGEAPDLPKDRRGSSLHAKQLQRALESSVTEALTQLANSLRTSLHNVLLFGAMLTMERFTGQKKLSLGIPVSMRTAVNLGQLPGMLVNVLPISCDFTEDLPVSQQIKAVEEQVIFANQGVLCDLQKESLSAPSLSVVFSHERATARELALGEAGLQSLSHSLSAAKYDLILGATEEEQGQVLTLSYGTEIFEAETAQSILDSYYAILRELGSGKETLCSQISSLTEEQKERLRELAGQNPEEIGGETVLHSIRTQAEQQPDRIALVCGTRSLCYRELLQRAEAYAFCLQGKGFASGDLVAVYMADGMEAVCALLGTAMAGLAYLPLDPHTPRKRLETILENSRCKLVLTDEGLAENVSSCPVLCGRNLLKTGESFPIRASLEDVAYVIYTSGSTGVPKGVSVSHKALKNLVQWHTEQYALTSADVTTRFAGFGFDAAVWEIFPTLAVGASLHVIPEEMRLDLKALAAYYDTYGITVSFLPTPICEEFLKLPCKSLRLLLTGGDKLNHYENRNSYTLYNNYGPTENTVVATCYEVKSHSANIPIGRPIRNVRAFVLDDRGQPVPPYGRGELYLAGNSLAEGYYLDPKQTEERFLQTAMGRLYRTGDLVRWNPQGDLEFLGRRDDQIKISGNRIELGEIEGALCALPHIQAAAATVIRGEKGAWILAYYTGREGRREEELKKSLAPILPAYMIPRRILPIESIPLTLNGKVDRKALATLPIPEEKQEKLSLTPTEERLLGLWQELLGQEQIGLSDHFMEIGGNSILVVKMQDALEKSYPNCVSISDIFALPTISLLAEHIDRAQKRGETLLLEALALKSTLPRGKEAGDRGWELLSDRGPLHRRLREMEAQDPKLLAHLLRSCYCATLSLMAQGDELSLYCWEEQTCFALTVPLCGEFGTVLSHVTKEYDSAKKLSAPDFATERRSNGLICAYSFQGGLDNPLFPHAEFTWSCDLNQEEFRLRAACTKLSDRLLKTLLNRFLQVLRAVLGVG